MWPEAMQVGGEKIYELVILDDGQGFGVAIVDNIQSHAHQHDEVEEIYVLISGTLAVVFDNHTHTLDKFGDSITIKPGTPHRAISLDGAPAKIIVISILPWRQKDHHFLENRPI